MPETGCFGRVSGAAAGPAGTAACSPCFGSQQQRETWLESEVRRLQGELDQKKEEAVPQGDGDASLDPNHIRVQVEDSPDRSTGEQSVGSKKGQGVMNQEPLARHNRRTLTVQDAEDVADVMREESASAKAGKPSVRTKLPSEVLGNMSAYFMHGFDNTNLANSLLGFRKPLRVAMYLIALGGVVFILISQSLHLGAHDDDHGDDHSADDGADHGADHGDGAHRMLYGLPGGHPGNYPVYPGAGRRLGGGASATMVNIAFTLTASCVITLILNFLGLPLLLGYILGGVAVGPIGLKIVPDATDIGELSALGLIFLLFMIGLELDVKELLKMGKVVLVTGLLQYPICFGTMYGIFVGLESIGLSFGELPFSSFYVGMVCGISSTMIVVKLLSEKCETDTMPGRLTIGILIFQDIWAIIVLAIQPNLDSPEIVGIAKQFGMIAVLIAISLTYAKFVMPAVLFYASKSVELMLVLSLGWCFFIGCIAIQPYIGLSMELASLIAGVALATFPYSAEFNGKIKYIRDFFITLFFAGLGMQIPVPTPIPILKAFLVAFVVLLIRPLGIFFVVCILGGGAQLGAIATINLSQISEFALVICSLGMTYDHIKEDTLTIIIWTFAILAISASYLIGYNAKIYRAVAGRVRRLCGRAPLEDSNAGQDTINFSFVAVNLDFGVLEQKVALKTAFEATMKESIMEVVNPAKENKTRVALSSGISDSGTGTQVDVAINCEKAQTKAIEASITPEMSGKMTLTLINSGMDEASLGDLSVASISEPEVIESEDGHGHQDIILLGFHRIAFMLIAEFQAKSPDMLKHLHVIDVNQSIMPALRKKGVKCTYGDICAPDVLHHCHHGEPRLVLCTIPDSLLQGVTNVKLLKIAQEVWPSAHYIVTADNPQQANMLYQQGAHYVLRSAKLCAERLQDLLTKHRKSMTSAESELSHLFNSYRAKDKDKRTSFIQQKLH